MSDTLLSPEAVAEYDAETVVLIGQAEACVIEAELAASAAKSAAKSARLNVKLAGEQLRELIRERADGRGKAPPKTLLNFIPPVAKWRGCGLDAIALHRDTRKAIDSHDVKTLGQLHAAITAPWPIESGPPFGLSMNDLADVRQLVQAIIDAEFNATEEAGKYGADEAPDLSELWREYPVKRWERFGLTPKDVEKLAAGEVKRETGLKPINTVGDLSNFSKPTESGYSRGYKDVKGLGDVGAERVADAEVGFWKWWNGEGLNEFARERGLIREAVAGGGSGVPSARGPSGAGTDIAPYVPNSGPGDAEQGEPWTDAEREADAEARNRTDLNDPRR